MSPHLISWEVHAVGSLRLVLSMMTHAYGQYQTFQDVVENFEDFVRSKFRRNATFNLTLAAISEGRTISIHRDVPDDPNFNLRE